MNAIDELDTTALIKKLTRYIALAIALLVLLIIVSISVSREQVQQSIIKEHTEKVKRSITHTVKYLTQSYIYKARYFVETKIVAKLLERKDKAKLLEILDSAFKLTQEQTPYLKTMQIYLADGSSFLKTHKLNESDKEIFNPKAMLKKVKQTHKLVSGYEIKGSSYIYRVIAPIMNEDGVYLGAYEISLDANYIANTIYEMDGYPGLILTKNDVNKLRSNDKQKRILSLSEIQKILSHEHKFKLHGEKYLSQSFVLENFEQTKSLQLLFFQDITEETSSFSYAQYPLYIGILLVSLFVVRVVNRLIKRYQKRVVGIYNQQINKIKMNEFEIEKSQKYHKTLFDTMPNILIVTNGKHIEDANIAMLDFFSYKSLEQFSLKHECICEFFLEEDGSLGQEVGDMSWLDYVKANPEELHKVSMLKDGEIYHFLVDAHELEHGNKNRDLVSFVDITEIEKLNERLNAAINGSNDGLWDWNLITNEVYLAPRWKEMLGYKDEELENNFDTWESRVHPDDFEVTLKGILETQKNPGVSYEGIHRLRHKDGSWVWVLDRGKAIFDKDGKAIRMVGFHTDVTKEKNLELLLSNTINSVSNFIFVKDSNYKYIECNKAFSNFVGKTREEIIGRDDYELFSKEIADGFRENDKKISRNRGLRSNFEWVVYPDGRRVYLLTSKSPLHDVNGNILGIVGTSVDMTMQKNLEDELIGSQKQFEQFMDFMPANVLIQDEHFEVIYANKKAELFFQQSSSEQRTQTLHEFNKRVFEKGYYEELVEFYDENNERLIHRILGFKIVSDEKIKLGLVSMDITDSYHAQYEVSRLKSALDKSPISIMMTDVDGNIEYVNPYYTTVSGYSKEQLIGENPRLVKSGLTSDEDYKRMWEEISSGHVYRSDVRNVAKDGSYFWEDSTIIPSFNTRGEVNGYIAFKQDITQDMAIRQQLKEQEEIMIAQSRHAAMGEMISMIAHQWRQPLSIISMQVNNILVDIELESMNEETLETNLHDIIDQTNHLSQTIDDFRDFFKPNKLKGLFLVEDVFVEAYKVIKQSLINNNIEIINNFQSTTKVRLYERELQQVLINILNNAKEALQENREEDKKITNNIYETEDDVIIEICDNGGGVQESLIEKIFDPYFSTKNEKNGTGLGLYMSKIIIEKHLHGELKVQNVEDGACFVIEIPKTSEE